jgi:hypothetical protein
MKMFGSARSAALNLWTETFTSKRNRVQTAEAITELSRSRMELSGYVVSAGLRFASGNRAAISLVTNCTGFIGGFAGM